jgi:hypothetical protein
MPINTGAILTALILGVVLAAIASWVVSGLYRRRMLVLMRQAPAPAAAAIPAAPPDAAARPVVPADRPDVLLDSAAQRAAMWRYTVAITGIGLLIGLTHAVLALFFIYGKELLSPGRAITLGLVYAWPVALTWGLMRRWSWPRTWAAVAVYLLVVLVIVRLRSVETQPLADTVSWLAGLVLIPVAVTLLIGASGRIRAIAPYLLPLFLLLAAGTVGVQLWLVQGIDDPPRWVLSLAAAIGAWPAIVAIGLLPWVVLAWPAWAAAKWLARAYRAKRFSDLWYLMAAYWAVVLMASALPSLQGSGPVALVELLPWLWLPLGLLALRGWLAPRVPPPTLLVLRVFQQDASVQALFDRVVERWRLVGNTVLIAGTDLLSRTLDPDDVFAFLNGRLAQRFIGSDAQLAERLRELDLQPDPDGRYRVNECYCFDSTWQQALAALMQRANVVLMDLRGFQSHNRGCRHELAVLAHSPHLQHVVLLADTRTDRDTAAAEVSGAPAGRFIWVDAQRLDRRRVQEIVAGLLGAAPRPAR